MSHRKISTCRTSLEFAAIHATWRGDSEQWQRFVSSSLVETIAVNSRAPGHCDLGQSALPFWSSFREHLRCLIACYKAEYCFQVDLADVLSHEYARFLILPSAGGTGPQ